MPIGKLLDYSAQSKSINLKAVKSAGYEAVFRYVCASDANLPGKLIRPAERDAILAAGLDIGLHGEDESGAVLKGRSRGLEQGKQWASYAKNVLDAPKGMTIVAAIDTDTGGYTKIVDDYLRGVDEGLAGYYEMGVYGSHGVITGAHNASLGNSCYYMTNAWGLDTPPAFCHIHQHGEDNRFGSVDYNDVYLRPYGSWLQTLKGETDMPLTAAELNAILGEGRVTTQRVGDAVHAEADATRVYIKAQIAALAALIKMPGGLTAAQAQQIAEDAAAKAVDGITVTIHGD